MAENVAEKMVAGIDIPDGLIAEDGKGSIALSNNGLAPMMEQVLVQPMIAECNG